MKLRSTSLCTTWLRAALLALLLFLMASPAFSQGCAMCYSTAAAASKEGQKAISKGVLVLLFPPAAFMSLGVGLALYYAKKRDRENAARDAAQPASAQHGAARAARATESAAALPSQLEVLHL